MGFILDVLIQYFIGIDVHVHCMCAQCYPESPTIEESPKWHLLSMVLNEIHKESAANTKSELTLDRVIHRVL